MAQTAVFGFAFTGYSAVNLVLNHQKFVSWVVSPDADTDKIISFLKAPSGGKTKVILLASAGCIRMVPKKLREGVIIAVFDTPEKLQQVSKKTEIMFMDFEFKSGSVLSQRRVEPRTINALFSDATPPEEELGIPSVPVEIYRGSEKIPSFRVGLQTAVEGITNPKKRKAAIKVFIKLFIGYYANQDYKEERAKILAQGADRHDVMALQRWIKQNYPLLSYQKVARGSSVEDALSETKEQKYAKDLDYVLGILPPPKNKTLKFAVNRRRKPKVKSKGKGKGKKN